jgi:hypothetical protein
MVTSCYSVYKRNFRDAMGMDVAVLLSNDSNKIVVGATEGRDVVVATVEQRKIEEDQCMSSQQYFCVYC